MAKAKSLKDVVVLPNSKWQLQNRLLKAPMTERLATYEPSDHTKSGIVTPELLRLYRIWGEGGIGILVTGNIMIDREHIEYPGNIILEDDSHDRLQSLSEMARLAQAHGSVAIAQLSHPGRQANLLLQANPVSVSDLQLEGTRMGMQFGKPKALTEEEVGAIVGKFAKTASLCHRAGFAGVQLHAAHGYLLSSFLSKRTNNRTDKYGGSLENRSRIIFEIISAIRQSVNDPRFSISLKLNSVEFQDGFSAEECHLLCLQLQNAQVDFVELSGGTYEELHFEHRNETTVKREAYFLDFAKMITPGLDDNRTLAYLTGGFRSGGAMAQALSEEICTGCGLGRPFCDDPTLAKKLLCDQQARAPDNQVNSALSIVAAGVNLTRMAKGMSPVDFGDERIVSLFNDEVQVWLGEASELAAKQIVRPGYLDLGVIEA